jgi:hypothetical protein
MDVRRYAPTTAPTIPGQRSFRNIAPFTFRNQWWESPDTPVVKHSAACTVALVAAGGTPYERRRLEAVTP